jgi:hypothetical protein
VTAPLSAQHEWLRRDTAKLLGYDYANLTAAESVRLDRAAMLRLELDDCQTKKLAGQPFDMNKYVVASEALERLMGGDPEVPAINHEHDFDGAFEELSQLLADRSDRLEMREERVSDVLRQEIVKLKTALAEKDGLINQLRSVPGAAQAAPPATTQSPPPTLRAEPPAGYLRRNDGFDVIQGGRYDRWSNRS